MKKLLYLFFSFFFLSNLSGQVDTLHFSKDIDTSLCAEEILLHAAFDTSEYNFQWSNGDTTPFIKVEMPADSINLEYLDSCLRTEKPEHTDSMFINIKMLLKRPAKANFSLIPGTACIGTPLQFENKDPNPTSGLQVMLNDSLVLDTLADIQLVQFDSLLIGEYDFRFIVTAESGCSDTMDFSLTLTDTPRTDFSIIGSDSIFYSIFCHGDKISFHNDESFIPDDSTTLYIINQGIDTLRIIPQFNDSSSIILNNLDSGNYNLNFILENANGCTDSQLINIQVDSLPYVKIVSELDDKYCQDSSLLIRLSGNQPNGIFSSSPPELIKTDSINNFYFNPSLIKSDIKVFYTYIDDSNRCENRDSIVIDQIYPVPKTKFEIDTTCAYDDVIFYNHTTGGLPGLSSLEVWENDSLITDTLPALNTSFTFDKLSPGNYTYDFIITNAEMCSDTFPLEFTIHPIPEVSFELPKDTFCFNEDRVLIQGIVDGIEADTGKFLGNYIKDNKNGTAYFEPTSVDSNFYIYYSYESDYGCTAKDSQYIKHIYQLPQIDFEGVDNNDEFCLYEDTIKLTSLYNEGKFNPLDILEEINNEIYLNPIDTGNFLITIGYEDIHGCSSSTSKEIIIHPLPYLDLPQDTSFSPGDTIKIGPKEREKDTEYLWSNGKTTRRITVNNPGIYSVTATNTVTTCINADTITVTFEVPSKTQDLDQMSMNIYPNPFTDRFILESQDYSGEFKVINARGIIFYEDKISAGESFHIDSNSWVPGVYYIVVPELGSVKMIKQ